jgi:hypothetical protein
MKNKDYLEFLTSRETPPAFLKNVARKDISLSFRKTEILVKFLAFQILGALFSMTFCPQFGMGLVEGHGISHYFRLMGDWACAAFCGSLFLSSGMLLAFIGMKGEELWWVWRRFKLTMVLLPAVLWAILMLTNISLSLSGESFVYHVTWIVMAILAQVLWFEMRRLSYVKILKDL